ncbi:hypothetical protein ABW19_dt0206428 [Dactylella cylindrospora]|nr:hypothetical protein ABW19_dt0206428 [Dactylella cylindrospora]
MSIEPPHFNPSTCPLFLPFLLPPRTRLLLRNILRKNAIWRRIWAPKTITRCFSTSPPKFHSGTNPDKPNWSKSLLSRQKPSSSTNEKYPTSEEDTIEEDEDPSFWRLRDEQGDLGRLTRIIRNQRRRVLVEAEQKRRTEELDRIRPPRYKPMVWGKDGEILRTDRGSLTTTLGPEREEDTRFWRLLRDRYSSDEKSKPLKLFDLPDVEAYFAENTPLQPTDHSIGDETPDSLENPETGVSADSIEPKRNFNDNSISYRAAPLNEFVLFAPEFSTHQQKEDFYATYVEKFLPPHLQAGNTHPTPPIVQKDQSPSSFLDMPYPSVFGSYYSEDTPSRENWRDRLLGESLKELEAEWETRWDLQSHLKFLYSLEIAREDGVDVVNSLLLKRRQREVIWIAKRLMERERTVLADDLIVWRRVSARSDLDDPESPSMANTVPDGFISYRKEELAEITRRRRGVGIILSSLTSMLLSGWRTEQAGKQSLFNVLTMLDLPPVLEREDTPKSETLFNSSFSHVLEPSKILAREPELELEMTPEEIFSTVAQLLAYLHVEEHVPPIVYSSKHPRLQSKHSEIVQIISAEVELAYGRELGFNLPQSDRPSGPIDWSLWIELVNCIAAERGLGVSATWLMLHGGHNISWENNPADLFFQHNETTRQQEAEAKISPSRVLEHGKLSLPSYLVPQAASACMLNSASDAWPPNTPGRMLNILKNLSDITGPYDPILARELLDHPEVNLHSTYAEKILQIGIKENWKLDAYYLIILGVCNRYEPNETIRIWAEVEKLVFGDSPILKVNLNGGPLETVVWAPDDHFQHPTHIKVNLLRHSRRCSRPDIFRHIVKTCISKSDLLGNPFLLNPLLLHAGEYQDYELAKDLLGSISPGLPHRTLTTILKMHLQLKQPREAQAVLDFMKRSGLEPDHVDLAIVTDSTFNRDTDEGFALIDRAVDRLELIERNKQDHKDARPKEKVFKEGIVLPVEQEPHRDPIGSPTWLAVLTAAVKTNNEERALQALRALGVDLSDVNAASKMGIRIFNTLLGGTVRREGSVKGMRMFKVYCLSEKELARLTDQSRKSHRSGDSKLDEGRRGPGRNIVGIQIENAEKYDSRLPPADSVNPLAEEANKRNNKRLKGVITPDIITLRIIVHQALKERRDYYATKRILGKLPLEPKGATWLKHNAYYDNSWERVLEWAKGVWEVMGYGQEEWGALVSKRMLGKRTYVTKMPSREGYGWQVPVEGGALSEGANLEEAGQADNFEARTIDETDLRELMANMKREELEMVEAGSPNEEDIPTEGGT